MSEGARRGGGRPDRRDRRWAPAMGLLWVALTLSACAGATAKSGAAPITPSTDPAATTAVGAAPLEPGPPITAADDPANAGLWLTYHRDTTRTGADAWPGKYGRVKPQWTASLDGKVYAEPLITAGGILVATEANSLYLLDRATGHVLWRTTVGAPVANSTLPCGNVDPLGITGTPAVDAATGTAYAVATVASPAMHYVLVAVRVTTGKVLWQRTLSGPGFDPKVENQRGALLVLGNMVYIAYGGRAPGDCGQYHGWLMASRTDGSGPLLNYQVPSTRAGGIWAPSGPAGDGHGNLVVTTGNTFDAGTYDHGNSVMLLSPSLQLLDSFAPSNWRNLNNGDYDLGSTGPVLVAPNLAFQVGKEGTGYLVDTAHMGGLGGQVASGRVCAPAFGGNAAANGYIYVPCTVSITALKLNPARRTFTLAWRGPHMNAGPPIVSGGYIWSVNLSNSHLYGIGAVHGGLTYDFPIGNAVVFTTPVAGGGMVYVAGGNVIHAFG